MSPRRKLWAVVSMTSALLWLVVTVRAQDKSPRTPAKSPAATTPTPAAPRTFTLTRLEQLTLDSAQKDAIIAQQQSAGLRLQLQAIQAQMQQADAAVGNSLKALHDRADEIKKEHGWDDKVIFNQAFDAQHPAFTESTPPPAAQPATPAPAAAPPADANKKPTR